MVLGSQLHTSTIWEFAKGQGPRWAPYNSRAIISTPTRKDSQFIETTIFGPPGNARSWHGHGHGHATTTPAGSRRPSYAKLGQEQTYLPGDSYPDPPMCAHEGPYGLYWMVFGVSKRVVGGCWYVVPF